MVQFKDIHDKTPKLRKIFPAPNSPKARVRAARALLCGNAIPTTLCNGTEREYWEIDIVIEVLLKGLDYATVMKYAQLDYDRRRTDKLDQFKAQGILQLRRLSRQYEWEEMEPPWTSSSPSIIRGRDVKGKDCTKRSKKRKRPDSKRIHRSQKKRALKDTNGDSSSITIPEETTPQERMVSHTANVPFPDIAMSIETAMPGSPFRDLSLLPLPDIKLMHTLLAVLSNTESIAEVETFLPECLSWASPPVNFGMLLEGLPNVPRYPQINIAEPTNVSTEPNSDIELKAEGKIFLNAI